jgi:hypothetical protein
MKEQHAKATSQDPTISPGTIIKGRIIMVEDPKATVRVLHWHGKLWKRFCSGYLVEATSTYFRGLVDSKDSE